MRVLFFLFAGFLTLQSCSSTRSTVKSVEKEILVKDTIQIRAIVVTKKQLWYAGTQSKAGTYFFSTGEHQQVQLPAEKVSEFRSLAYNGSDLCFLSIADPAQLILGTDQLQHLHQVYREQHEKVFYDAIAFCDAQHGIAIGDPTNKTLAVLVTSDGGYHWTRIPEHDAPLLTEGEAAFAASNTNIVTQNKCIWVVTGGKKSRIWKSTDYGFHWEKQEIPIQQGGEMTGAFSAAFYNESIGVVAGGDYAQQKSSEGNLVLTLDGGKTWKRQEFKSGPTYISCIQFIPGSHGKELVTVGAGGLFYSADQGMNWVNLDSNPALFTLRCLDKNTLIAAGKNRIIRYKLIR
ncbi:MAG: hypothetical protein RL607_1173 [Bacteroidota bacterium]